MLPEWPPGTVTVLATGGGSPHAVPISAAVRARPDVALLGLARRRESLARLRADPRVALVMLAEDDVAVTAHGNASVLGEVVEGVVAVRVDVDRVQHHEKPTFVIEGGVRWRWS